jgi:hypothetical protein
VDTAVGDGGGEQGAVRREGDGGDAASRPGLDPTVSCQSAAAFLCLGPWRQWPRVNHHKTPIAWICRQQLTVGRSREKITFFPSPLTAAATTTTPRDIHDYQLCAPRRFTPYNLMLPSVPSAAHTEGAGLGVARHIAEGARATLNDDAGLL